MFHQDGEDKTSSLSLPKLSFPRNKLFGRHKELNVMVDAYRRIVSVEGEVEGLRRDHAVGTVDARNVHDASIQEEVVQNDSRPVSTTSSSPSTTATTTEEGEATAESSSSNLVDSNKQRTHNEHDDDDNPRDTSTAGQRSFETTVAVTATPAAVKSQHVENDHDDVSLDVNDGDDSSSLDQTLEDLTSDYSLQSPSPSTASPSAGLRARLNLQNNTTKAVFISGHSGVGKSALVEAFTDELQSNGFQFLFSVGKYSQQYISIGPLAAVDQAMSHLVNTLMARPSVEDSVDDITYATSVSEHAHAKEMQRIQDNLDREGLVDTPEGSLLANFIPSLKPLLLESSRKEPGHQHQHDERHMAADMTHLTFVLRNFIRAVSCKERPLILHLDDIQWASAATLELLGAILSDTSIRYFYFIGSYRPNEMAYSYLFDKLQDEIRAAGEQNDIAGQSRLINIELANLSPKHVRDFIDETILSSLREQDSASRKKLQEPDEERERELATLTELLYRLSLGNIFFCRQALEELVRKNVMYYDERVERWRFAPVAHHRGRAGGSQPSRSTSGATAAAAAAAAAGASLESLLSEDIIQMVKSKLYTLPRVLLQILTIMSHVRHYLSLPLLMEVVTRLSPALRADDDDGDVFSLHLLTYDKMKSLLEIAVEEGILLNTFGATDTYKFSHDRIQESAYYSLEEAGFGDHNELRVEIAQVLIRLAKERGQGGTTAGKGRGVGKEWMFFVAAKHMNQVPFAMVPDPLELAKLYLHVAKLYLQKAAVDKAISLLRSAISCIEYMEEEVLISAPDGGKDGQRSQTPTSSKSPWDVDYQFCLSLHDQVIETEFASENIQQAKSAMQVIFDKAKTANDKYIAHFTYVLMTIKLSNEDKQLGVRELIKILNENYGESIPQNPTSKELLAERLRLTVTLRNRPISILADLPIAKDDRVMKLISKLCELTGTSWSKGSLEKFVHLRAIRRSLEHGITKYLPGIITSYSVPLRKDEKFQECYKHAVVVNKLFDRFPEERGNDYTVSSMILHSGILHLQQPFSNSLDLALDNYQRSFAVGNVEFAMVSAMHYAYFYYAEGLPLNSILESKLLTFEEKSRHFNKSSFTIIFQFCRQSMYNLQGKARHPTKMRGRALNEEQSLSKLEGNCRKMATRDLSIFRLALACIFSDIKTMVAMMERLRDFPLFDLPIVRQHLRLTFHGLAAFIAGRYFEEREFTKLGQRIMKEVRKLDKVGSVNAHPIYLCLKAAEEHKVSAYENAITACTNANMIHLEALMNEHCGRLLRETNEKERSKPHLRKATCLYHDWGAIGKVKQLQKRYVFLENMSLCRRTRSRNASTTTAVTGTTADLTNKGLTSSYDDEAEQQQGQQQQGHSKTP